MSAEVSLADASKASNSGKRLFTFVCVVLVATLGLVSLLGCSQESWVATESVVETRVIEGVVTEVRFSNGVGTAGSAWGAHVVLSSGGETVSIFAEDWIAVTFEHPIVRGRSYVLRLLKAPEGTSGSLYYHLESVSERVEE